MRNTTASFAGRRADELPGPAHQNVQMYGDGTEGSHIQLPLFYALGHGRHGRQVPCLLRGEGVGLAELLLFQQSKPLPKQLHHPLVAVGLPPQAFPGQGPQLRQIPFPGDHLQHRAPGPKHPGELRIVGGGEDVHDGGHAAIAQGQPAQIPHRPQPAAAPPGRPLDAGPGQVQPQGSPLNRIGRQRLQKASLPAARVQQGTDRSIGFQQLLERCKHLFIKPAGDEAAPAVKQILVICPCPGGGAKIRIPLFGQGKIVTALTPQGGFPGDHRPAAQGAAKQARIL